MLISPLLKNSSLDTIYVLTGMTGMARTSQPIDNDCPIVEIHNEKELMRHFCTKAMLSYHNQGVQYKKKDEFGLANLCSQYALNALEQAKKFR
jgi:hypothetical protein